jgi:hypothetical protein
VRRKLTLLVDVAGDLDVGHGMPMVQRFEWSVEIVILVNSPF